MDPLFCPAPGETIDWDAYDAPWVAPMAACMQDSLHHAEGDVWTHTKMVCDALVADDRWAALSEGARWVTFVACLLHDIAKPETTRVEGDRIRHPRHSTRGAKRARRLMYEADVPPLRREAVVNLILWHQVPFFLIEQDAPEDRAARLSLTTPCRLLGLVNRADGRGRICEDGARLEENVGLFEALCEAEGCLDRPYGFATPHARFRFAQGRTASRYDAPPAVPTCHVTLLCGLPGAGKDTWLERHPVGPVISLDRIRAELGAAPTGAQGPVVRAAEARAKDYLRRKADFVWNATNLTRDVRGRLVKLFDAYGAHVHIVYVEADQATWRARNRSRPEAARLPTRALVDMLDRWQVPDVTEAHEVTWVLGDEEVDAGYASL